MNRRDAILSVVSASIGAMACGGQKAVAQPAGGGSGHHHGGDAALAEAVNGCLTKGQDCIGHCLGMIAGGDASMGPCLKAAHDMHAVMEALAAAISSGSRHTAALAKVAMEFCKDCQAECAKHAQHPTCKACHDACVKTIAECQRVAGA